MIDAVIDLSPHFLVVFLICGKCIATAESSLDDRIIMIERRLPTV